MQQGTKVWTAQRATEGPALLSVDRMGTAYEGRVEGVLQRPSDQEWSDSESRDTVWFEGRPKTGEMGPSSDARRWSTEGVWDELKPVDL